MINNINKHVLAVSVIIVSVVFLLDSWYIDTEMLQTPMVSYEKLEKIANTGDLVIFRWNVIDIGFRLFSKYSHVGMIVRHNDKLYILETHPKETLKPDVDDSGVHLYCLKKRLEEYNGEYYFTQFKTSLSTRENMRSHIIKNLKRYKNDIPFDNNFRNIFVLNFFCNLFGIKLPKRKAMFCSEFIATVLDECNVYKHHKNLSSINPGTFLEFKKNNEKELYSPIYYILIS